MVPFWSTPKRSGPILRTLRKIRVHYGSKGRQTMPPEVSQETVPLFVRRAAALAEIEAEQKFIARPIEFARVFYFALRTPGTVWATDQNGKLRTDLKGDRYSLSRAEFLDWLAASIGILCID